MANPEHLEILKQGVEVWNKWREDNPDVKPDLSDANLYLPNKDKLDTIKAREGVISAAKLLFSDIPYYFGNYTGVNFSSTNFSRATLYSAFFDGANFSKAVIDHTDLSEADFNNVNFCEADIRDTKFIGVKAVGALFNNAHLSEVIFSASNLENVSFKNSSIFGVNYLMSTLDQADFTNAKIAGCIFSDIDLSATIGLATTNHEYPSSVGVDTIFRSKGKVPHSFLRNCGVPEDFIKLIPSLTSQPFQFYSCFISYSSQDDDFARRLHSDLQSNAVRVWFAPEDLKIGDRIRDRIDKSILFHDKLLLILTEQSIQSDWVEKEVETAFEKERKNPGKTVLFPIRLDDAVMDTDKAWAADIRRTRHIGDFTDWKNHDSYKKNFDRLLGDLKASEE